MKDILKIEITAAPKLACSMSRLQEPSNIACFYAYRNGLIERLLENLIEVIEREVYVLFFQILRLGFYRIAVIEVEQGFGKYVFRIV